MRGETSLPQEELPARYHPASTCRVCTKPSGGGGVGGGGPPVRGRMSGGAASRAPLLSLRAVTCIPAGAPWLRGLPRPDRARPGPARGGGGGAGVCDWAGGRAAGEALQRAGYGRDPAGAPASHAVTSAW